MSSPAILFVDNSKDRCEAFVGLFEALGFRVSAFECADPATEEIKKGSFFDLVIVSLHLPGTQTNDFFAMIRSNRHGKESLVIPFSHLFPFQMMSPKDVVDRLFDGIKGIESRKIFGVLVKYVSLVPTDFVYRVGEELIKSGKTVPRSMKVLVEELW